MMNKQNLVNIPETTKPDLLTETGIKEFSTHSYSEASTDRITKTAGVSKGLLFHYFGSKKGLYLHCISESLERLIIPFSLDETSDFYQVIFSSLDEKIRLCKDFPDEMHLINLASREASAEIISERNELFLSYRQKTLKESTRVFEIAIATLPQEEKQSSKIVKEGLQLYCSAIIQKYLTMYQQTPDIFFQKADEIKSEMKEYLDLFLFGIVERNKEKTP